MSYINVHKANTAHNKGNVRKFTKVSCPDYFGSLNIGSSPLETRKAPKAKSSYESTKVKEIISKRESYRSLLLRLCEVRVDSGESKSAGSAIDWVDVLTAMRLFTLDAIESIVHWRNNTMPIKPFIWNGDNYLIKLQVFIDN